MTVKGKDGMETFRTILSIVLHFETSWISTNCGPCGTKGNEEPNDDKIPLIDRTVAHCVRAVRKGKQEAASSNEADFAASLEKPEEEAKITQLRIMSGLTCLILIFLKHMPFLQPDCAYALTLFAAWDDILWNEFNLARPSPRKQTKRRMTLMVFIVETALAEKFWLKESAMAFEDMHPDANGNLQPWSSLQLVDVLRNLQPSVTVEAIALAWSHGIDYANATCAHVFHATTLLAQIHGSKLDFKTFVDARSTSANPPTPSGAAGPSGSSDVLRAQNGLTAPDDDRVRRMEQGAARAADGTAVTTAVATQSMMSNDKFKTRESIKKLHDVLAKERLCRNTVSKRLQENPELAGDARNRRSKAEV